MRIEKRLERLEKDIGDKFQPDPGEIIINGKRLDQMTTEELIADVNKKVKAMEDTEYGRKIMKLSIDDKIKRLNQWAITGVCPPLD
ncbi:MAG: hypothetical protein PHC54_02480 [Candidatus Omnitrophica bacterium]|nr:hypothetical protein [Candidatus Omnitrophota bacterium]MDD5592261.1 hypothetical protein [Candidatus Omnitrophota bacterium]